MDPLLNSYYLTRWVCPQCGTFEIGTCCRPDPVARCPWCDGGLDAIAQCRGMTSRPLPFTSDPRFEGVTDTPVDVINGYLRDRRQRNHGNGKSTGRKRGGKGRMVYRGPSDQVDTGESDRERYASRKQSAAADLSDVFGT